MPDPNVGQLWTTSPSLGGCATGLLIADSFAPSARPIFDVDAIAELTTYAVYVQSPNACENLDFAKTARKVHPSAAGSAVATFWMSCRSMKGCWDSQTAGTAKP
jgi:hypothetical protein